MTNKDLIKSHKTVEEINENLGELATITNKKLAIIQERMVEIDRGTLAVGGRSQTQTTSQLMTLTMMSDSPYRRLRQCLAEIDKKRNALDEIYYKMKILKVKIKTWYKKGDEISVLKAQQGESQLLNSKSSIEGAFKDIAVYQASYDEMIKSHNIPEKWDEMDAEREEVDHHIRQAFRQSHRQMVSTGTIDVGNMEYLEQFGVHPQTAIKIIRDYINTEDKEISEGKAPTVNRLYNFLDSMVNMFHGSHKLVLERIGIKDLIKPEFLYIEEKEQKNGK